MRFCYGRNRDDNKLDPFQSLSGFLRDPEVAIYSLAGAEFTIEGKVEYSYVRFRSGFFAGWKMEEEKITDSEYEKMPKLPNLKGFEVVTSIEKTPKKPTKSTGESGLAYRFRHVSIHVSKECSESIHDSMYRRFMTYQEMYRSIIEYLIGNGWKPGFPIDLSSREISSWPFGEVKFDKMGMQPLTGSISQVAFLDCFLDILRKRHNNGQCFDYEGMAVYYSYLGTDARLSVNNTHKQENNGLKPW